MYSKYSGMDQEILRIGNKSGYNTVSICSRSSPVMDTAAEIANKSLPAITTIY